MPEKNDFEEAAADLKNYGKLSAKAMSRAMQLTVRLIEGEWKIVAPVDTGRYRASITAKVRGVAGNKLSGTVGTNVNARGFPYPLALEESSRYHYRAGPRVGERTAGQVGRAINRKRDTINRFFGNAQAEVARELLDDD